MFAGEIVERKKNGTVHRQTPTAGVTTGGSTKTNRLAGDAQMDERRSRDSDDGNFWFAFYSSIYGGYARRAQ